MKINLRDDIEDIIFKKMEIENIQDFQNERLNPRDIDYVIYHKRCLDGFASAYCVWKYFSLYYPEKLDSIIFKEAQINDDFPKDLTDRNVLICDYSYSYDKICKILKIVKNLLIIDHHKTSEKELSQLDEKYKIFDMNHSGCYLTWSYIFPNIKHPMLILYIEDRDLWKKEMSHTDEFFVWFSTQPYDFSVYDSFVENESLLIENILKKGCSFIDLNRYNIEDTVRYTSIKFVEIKDKYYFVGYINSNTLKSDIGNKIIEKLKDEIDFAAVYSISDWDDSTLFSLRSDYTHTDVSEVAKIFGGGGHRNASGVKLKYVTNVLPGTLPNSLNLHHVLKSENQKLTFQNIDGVMYKILYVYSQNYKKQIGKYLLQKNKDVDIVSVWSYNPIKNITTFVNIVNENTKICLEEKIKVEGLCYK